jgi:hypothetical protein
MALYVTPESCRSYSFVGVGCKRRENRRISVHIVHIVHVHEELGSGKAAKFLLAMPHMVGIQTLPCSDQITSHWYCYRTGWRGTFELG